MTEVQPEPRDMLRALLDGHYQGHGAQQALAEDLGMKLTTLRSWLYGQRAVSYDGRQRIRRLWEVHGSPQVPPGEPETQ